jgi:hypothetical protein
VYKTLLLLEYMLKHGPMVSWALHFAYMTAIASSGS